MTNVAKEAIENYYDVLEISINSTIEVIKKTIEEKLAYCEKGTPDHAKLLHIKTVFINETARERYDQQLIESEKAQAALQQITLYKQTLQQEESHKQLATVDHEKYLSDLNQKVRAIQEKRKEKYDKENTVLERAYEKYIQGQQRRESFENILNLDMYIGNFESHYKIMAWMMSIYFVCSVLYAYFDWPFSWMQMLGAYLFIILTIVLVIKAIRLLFMRRLIHVIMASQDALFLVIMYTFFF